MNMKIKISFAITLLIYIILVLLINIDPIIIGYLCSFVFVILFILFVVIFKNAPDDKID